MGRLAISETTLDDAMLLREKGFTIEQVSRMLNVGQSTLSRAYAAYGAAKDGDIEQLKRTSAGSAVPVIWACKKFGLDVDAIVYGKEPKKEDQKQDATDNTGKAFLSLLDAIKQQTDAIRDLTKAVDDIDKRLSSMQLTQSGFRGDMSERIKGVIEAVNVNGDIATKENEKCAMLLDRIARNTKPRPWQQQEGQQT